MIYSSKSGILNADENSGGGFSGHDSHDFSNNSYPSPLDYRHVSPISWPKIGIANE